MRKLTPAVLWRMDSIGKAQNQGKQLKASDLTPEGDVRSLNEGDIKRGDCSNAHNLPASFQSKYYPNDSNWNLRSPLQRGDRCIPLDGSGQSQKWGKTSKYAFYYTVEAYIDSNN